MSSVTSERARIAALSRSRTSEDPDLVQARQNLKALRLEQYVRKAVNEAPSITDEQADRIAGLLRPAKGGDR